MLGMVGLMETHNNLTSFGVLSEFPPNDLMTNDLLTNNLLTVLIRPCKQNPLYGWVAG